jgi:NAD(P)H-hydrate epimerase
MSPSSEFWLSRAEVRELDSRASSEFGVPSIVLMENAGRGAAELLMRLNPNHEPVTVLCGPGNNGGDGFVIARHLDNHGRPVHIWLMLEGYERSEEDGGVVLGTDLGNVELIGAELSLDSRVNFHIAHRSGIGISVLMGSTLPWQRDMLRTDLELHTGWIVDALFGTGLRIARDKPFNGALGPPFDEAISAANLSGHPILAVDIPSGVDCDEGEPVGQTTIRATHTATFVAPKKGFSQPAAQPWLGEVHVIDIGAPRRLVEEYRSRPR